MPVQTQIACPNCRQPVRVEVDQLFDAANPGDKQRFLSGQFNLIHCSNCHYQGRLASPLVYHDAEKQLLLTFIPLEMAMPKPEQEKFLGRIVNQVTARLSAEKRKGYLFSPLPMLTLQGMVEKILEADGVTREMLEAQRKKAALLQELLQSPEESIPALIREHDAEIDETFLQLLSLSAGDGDPRILERFEAVQAQLLEHSTLGRQLRQEQADLEAAARSLQAVGEGLTQEKFLELVVSAPNENQALALVGMARPAVDYGFFQLLTRRIEGAQGPEKERLTALREKVLDLTREMDAAAEARAREAGEVLRSLVESDDPASALPELLPRIDETFLGVLSANLQAARQSGRTEIVERLDTIRGLVMAAVAEAAPPEIRFINELLGLPTEAEALERIRARARELDQNYFDAMAYAADSLRRNGQTSAAERVEHLHSLAMQEAMEARLRP